MLKNQNKMETQNENDMQAWTEELEQRHRRGKVWAGIFIVAVGSLLLARQLGALIPEWIFSWKMLLIGVGLFMGARRAFRGAGWLIPVAIGSVFLLEDFYPELTVKAYLWPLLFIFLGLVMIFKPRRKFCGPHEQWKRHHWGRSEKWKQWEEHTQASTETSPENRVEIVTVFGGVKKNIISKDFAGGEIVSVFGGTSLNLSQSDINGTVVLDTVQVFGGTKLIIPQHWQVKSEVVNVFGGVDDKRPIVPESSIDNSKILIIKGTCFFGGLEICCY